MLAAAVLVLALVGCAQNQSRLRYGDVLDAPSEPADVALRIAPPSAACIARAGEIVPPEDIVQVLSPSLYAHSVDVVRGLHPIAKQVLRQVDSVWFARTLDGADARFIPCEGREGRSGLILMDASASVPNRPSSVQLPDLYWHLLGATTTAHRVADELHSTPRTSELAQPETAELQEGGGLRYVLLHEIGHALSLLAGEFAIGSDLQFELESWDRYLAFSWRGRRGYHLGGALHDNGGVVPARLAWQDWQQVRRLVGSSASWLIPGYERRRSRDGDFCGMIDKLPRAGFVTPTAALSPMEDYAELFAHTILAAENRIRRDDTIEVTLENCSPVALPTPFYADGLRAKREYLAGHLRIAGIATPPRKRPLPNGHAHAARDDAPRTNDAAAAADAPP